MTNVECHVIWISSHAVEQLSAGMSPSGESLYVYCTTNTYTYIYYIYIDIKDTEHAYSVYNVYSVHCKCILYNNILIV